MNGESPMLLLGVGGSGCAMARGVNRAFGEGLRYALVDTDAATGLAGGPFVLLGGERLAGRGSGGDTVAAKMAAQESIKGIDPVLEGVRLAVIVTALGGGTGGAATVEVLKHLGALGIPTIVFATEPFQFEGHRRAANAGAMMPHIESAANATFLLKLDELIAGAEAMNDALKRAVDTIASGVTLFWRLVEKPGYLRLDAERLRHLLARAGRGRFATVTMQGETRAAEAIDALRRSTMLAGFTLPVRAVLCGVLAGDDLRLKEVGEIADGVRSAVGGNADFELATVNDEATFSGRLCVVVMLFEASTLKSEEPSEEGGTKKRKRNPLAIGPHGRGKFNDAAPSSWHGHDLDIPTYIRQNINLDF